MPSKVGGPLDVVAEASLLGLDFVLHDRDDERLPFRPLGPTPPRHRRRRGLGGAIVEALAGAGARVAVLELGLDDCIHCVVLPVGGGWLAR